MLEAFRHKSWSEIRPQGSEFKYPLSIHYCLEQTARKQDNRWITKACRGWIPDTREAAAAGAMRQFSVSGREHLSSLYMVLSFYSSREFHGQTYRRRVALARN